MDEDIVVLEGGFEESEWLEVDTLLADEFACRFGEAGHAGGEDFGGTVTGVGEPGLVVGGCDDEDGAVHAGVAFAPAVEFGLDGVAVGCGELVGGVEDEGLFAPVPFGEEGEGAEEACGDGGGDRPGVWLEEGVEDEELDEFRADVGRELVGGEPVLDEADGWGKGLQTGAEGGDGLGVDGEDGELPYGVGEGVLGGFAGARVEELVLHLTLEDGVFEVAVDAEAEGCAGLVDDVKVGHVLDADVEVLTAEVGCDGVVGCGEATVEIDEELELGFLDGGQVLGPFARCFKVEIHVHGGDGVLVEAYEGRLDGCVPREGGNG